MKSYIVGLMALCAVFANAATVGAADIHDAARCGDWNAIQQELRNGVDVNCDGQYGHTALTYAARKGHTEVVRKLLQVPGIDVNHASDNRATALIWAAGRGHADVIKTLLQFPSIDVNHAIENGDTALLYAIWAEHTEAVKILLQSPNIDVNHKVLSECRTYEIKQLIQAHINEVEAIKRAGRKTKSARK